MSNTDTETPGPLINISISQLGTAAGAIVASVVYTTSVTAGDASAFSADKGIRLLGKVASVGATIIAGDVAGRVVDTASNHFADVAKGHITTTSRIGAAATAIVAGAGTAIIITLTGVLVKHSAVGAAYLSRKAYDKIMKHYATYSTGKAQQVQLNAFFVDDALIIEDSTEPDYVVLDLDNAETFDPRELGESV